MAIVFFAVEALPIGVTGILMPLMAVSINDWRSGCWGGPGGSGFPSSCCASVCQSWVHLCRPRPCVPLWCPW
jgi:hypothetical protein